MPAVKTILTAFFVVTYAVLSHVALVIEDAFSIWRQLAVWVLILPVAGLACWGVVMALRSAGVDRLWQLAGGSAMLACLVWMVCGFRVELLTRLDYIYLIQHVAINSMLCWFFLQTLCRGRIPVITAVARTIHPDLPGSVVRYTRKVTVAWSIFFAVQVWVSLVIFYFFSIDTWSMFANVLNWPMVILMFAGEYACRKRCNPDFKHATIRESVVAYLNSRNRI